MGVALALLRAALAAALTAAAPVRIAALAVLCGAGLAAFALLALALGVADWRMLRRRLRPATGLTAASRQR